MSLLNLPMSDVHVEAPPSGGASHFGDEIWGKLLAFADLLTSEGEVRGLLGPREYERLWSRHILNSLAIVPDMADTSAVADIGSGAGFPGIVAGIVAPDVRVDLIETMDRRVQWLQEVACELALDNVRVLHARAEELAGKERYLMVTARAVAPLKKLVPWSFPLLESDGSLIALKGARAEQEIDDAAKMLRKYRARWVDIYERSVWGTDESTRVVEVRKM